MTSNTYDSTTDLNLGHVPASGDLHNSSSEALYTELLDIHNALEISLSALDTFIDRERAYTSPVITGDYTILITDKLILVDSTAGAINIFLPLVADAPGYDYDVKHIAGANTVKLFGSGVEEIDGSTLGVAIALLDSLRTKNDTVEWWVI